MFHHIATALDLEGLTTTQKLVLVAICNHANDEDKCWPSMERLAKICAVSDRTVRRAVRDLEGMGYLVTVSSAGRASNLYVVKLDEQQPSLFEDMPATVHSLEDHPGFELRTRSGSPGSTRTNGTSTRTNGTSTRTLCPPNPDTESGEPIREPTKEPDRGAPLSKNPTGKKRGTRLPTDWKLPKSWGDWALQQGLTENQVRTEAGTFGDHWHSTTRNATKVDWKKAWQVWIRKEVKRLGERQQRGGYKAHGEFDRFADDPRLAQALAEQRTKKLQGGS